MNYNQNYHPLRWTEFQMPLRSTLAEFKKIGARNIIFLLVTKTETMLLLNCESVSQEVQTMLFRKQQE